MNPQPPQNALQIEDHQDTGASSLSWFSIPAGQEQPAAQALLQCLAEGAEVSLCNEGDEGNEGTTRIRRSVDGLEMRVVGHGWTGSWTPIDENGFVEVVLKLSALNRGGHWSRQGRISKRK